MYKRQALAFAREQDNLIITCQKNKELLDQVKQEAEAAGSVCLAFAGDMGDFSFCQEVFAKANRHGLYPDLVINNAGISYIGLLQDMTPEEWDRIVRTNLTSVFNCSKLAIPHMLEQKSGKILNISSVWGNVGASCEVAYSCLLYTSFLSGRRSSVLCISRHCRCHVIQKGKLRPIYYIAKALCRLDSNLFPWYNYTILGSKGQKFDASLLAGEFLRNTEQSGIIA